MACECRACWYCDMPLARRHEHDHFPAPARHDGRDVVPICINCHDLKDRTLLADWPMRMLECWPMMPPAMRLMAAKLYVMILDIRAERAELMEA